MERSLPVTLFCGAWRASARNMGANSVVEEVRCKLQFMAVRWSTSMSCTKFAVLEFRRVHVNRKWMTL